jgi:hypothetical protein
LKYVFFLVLYSSRKQRILEGIMNSKDVVLRKVGDGKGYYDRCSAEAGIPDLSTIFHMFSEDEVRHADALRAVEDGARVELSHSPTLEGARRILRRLSVQDGALGDFHGDLGSYRTAMDFEADSVRRCGQLAAEAAQGWERDLLLKIAEEDEVHFTLLEYIRELLETTVRSRSGENDVH